MPGKHLPGTQRAREGGQLHVCDGALCERLTAVGPADHTHLAHALVQPQQSCTSLETPSPPLLVQLKQESARLFSAASNSSHNSIITLALLQVT